PGSSSWAIALATAPKWLGSNCWVSDGTAGRRRQREGDPGSPFLLGCFRDAVRLEAAGANPQPSRGPVHDGHPALQVGVPAPVRPVVRVADAVPRHRALATDLTYSLHGPVPEKRWAPNIVAPPVRAGRPLRAGRPVRAGRLVRAGRPNLNPPAGSGNPAGPL